MFLIRAIQTFILGSLFSLKKIIQRFTDHSFPMLVNGKKCFRAQQPNGSVVPPFGHNEYFPPGGLHLTCI